MRLNGPIRLWLVAAAVSLLATPAFGSGGLTFICALDLVARTECCCAGGHLGGTVGAGQRASLSPACCCRVSRTDARGATAAAASRIAAPVDAQALPAPDATIALDVVPGAQAWPAIRLAHPPPRAVPILLGKQSFLA